MNHPSSQTNRARCALYKKILDFLDEESVSGENSARELVYKFDEKSHCESLKRLKVSSEPKQKSMGMDTPFLSISFFLQDEQG